MNEPREFLIDMTVPAEERWQDVISASKRNALKLAHGALSALDRVPLAHVIRGAIAASHQRSQSLYDDDLSAWAAGLGMPHRDLMAANAAHETAQFNEAEFASISVVMASKKLGLVQGRNLDWDMKKLGDFTVVYHFVGGPLEFMAVSLPGLVGVLSGMGPGRFSISLARAMPQGRPTLDWAPSTLVRHVLETARDYETAQEMLAETPLRTPGIFTLASADGATASVIERTHKEFAVREYDGSPLIAANHYLSEQFADINSAPVLERSEELVEAATTAAKGLKITDPGDLFQVLTADGVVTDTTCQQLAFAPSEGLYCAVGRS